MPTQNVYFTAEEYQRIVSYGMDNNLTTNDVIKIVIEKGIKALEQAKNKIKQLVEEVLQ